MTSIVKQIEELRAMTVPELVARYKKVFGKEPKVKNREHLWKRIAWKIQEQRFGGLSVAAQRRLEELISEIDLPLEENQRAVMGKRRIPRAPQEPAIGTELVRVWKNQEIRVRIVDGGYEHEDVLYRSLSAVAKAVTGSHWNGPLFFGLRNRGKK